MLGEATAEARSIQSVYGNEIRDVLNKTGLRPPDALLVGPARTGTTWLKLVLGDHPDILMARGEPNALWGAGGGGLSDALRWYARHDIWRGPQKPHGLVVDKSPDYICLPESAVCILGSLLPHLKIVVGRRHETDRLWSVILHRMRVTGFTGSWQCFCSEFHQEIVHHLNAGRISKHISRWRNILGTGSVFLYDFAELRDSPHALANSLFDHISVRPVNELTVVEQFAIESRIIINPNSGNAASPPADLLNAITTLLS